MKNEVRHRVIKRNLFPWKNAKTSEYLFNAKGLDEESGMYYYETRYYSDEDIYGNKATTTDKVISVVNTITLGASKVPRYIGKGVAKIMDWMNKGTTGLSVGCVVKKESKKNKKGK
jgi:hypothetical protein